MAGINSVPMVISDMVGRWHIDKR